VPVLCDYCKREDENVRTNNKLQYFAAEPVDLGTQLGIMYSHGEGETQWRQLCMLDPSDMVTSIARLRAFADSLERHQARLMNKAQQS